MKSNKFSNLLVIGLLSLAIAGCKTSKTGTTPLPSGAGASGEKEIGQGGAITDGAGAGGAGAQATSMGGGEAASFNPDDMNQDHAALAAQTIYFDYDSSSIRPGQESKLTAVAAALSSDMSAKLLIEGHCDERGTEEYNRSLGERRALAAREALAGKGIDPLRVATRSYGEDRAADPGHDQSAWTKNRRDEFILLHAK